MYFSSPYPFSVKELEVENFDTQLKSWPNDLQKHTSKARTNMHKKAYKE